MRLANALCLLVEFAPLRFGPRLAGRLATFGTARNRHGTPSLASFLRGSGRAETAVTQVYALAAALCERAGEQFPETSEALRLIERLRFENGHPAPRLEDTPVRPLGRRGSPDARPRGWSPRRGPARVP